MSLAYTNEKPVHIYYWPNSACPRADCTGKLLEQPHYSGRLMCSHCQRCFECLTDDM